MTHKKDHTQALQEMTLSSTPQVVEQAQRSSEYHKSRVTDPKTWRPPVSSLHSQRTPRRQKNNSDLVENAIACPRIAGTKCYCTSCVHSRIFVLIPYRLEMGQTSQEKAIPLDYSLTTSKVPSTLQERHNDLLRHTSRDKRPPHPSRYVGPRALGAVERGGPTVHSALLSLIALFLRAEPHQRLIEYRCL